MTITLSFSNICELANFTQSNPLAYLIRDTENLQQTHTHNAHQVRIMPHHPTISITMLTVKLEYAPSPERKLN
jgi:hypothetical protein